MFESKKRYVVYRSKYNKYKEMKSAKLIINRQKKIDKLKNEM